MKDDSSFWVESDEPFSLPKKRKRKPRLKKLEFTGWGSKPLIEFLKSIGKDTSKQLKQYDVAAIVDEYVKANNLTHPGKKKKIICDQWLYALFGKKSVSRIKVYDLLEPHFVENHDTSEDDSECSLEEEDTTGLEKKASHLQCKMPYQQKRIPETPKSCFAAIIPENIKLVYLKRSLVLDLLKTSESFEDKVMDSFVRIRSDPNDYAQKNSHQLQQITGVRMTSEADNDDKQVHLQLSNYMKEVPVQKLSDDNFSEAECLDLHERVKAGSFKRLTVVELEIKAKMLHKDIIKHWIPREIAFLQNLINRANEKGWRRELYEHLERKKQLEKSSEQERLLAEIPKVIAEELEPEAASVDTPERVEEDISSPKLNPFGASDINFTDDAGSKTDYVIPKQVAEIDDHRPNLVQNTIVSAIVNGGDGSSREMQVVDLEDDEGSPGISGREVKPTQVIELSDDENEVEDIKFEKHTAVENPDNCIWHYVDPQGIVQGPFSMTLLKQWSDANYFDPDFMVWKVGQNQDNAVLLIDVLRQMFPCK